MLGTVIPTARISLVFLAAFVPLFAAQQTNTVAGEFVAEPPTLASLGFDWKISGDDNRNARVEVAYRKVGETQWRNALPMLRLQHESVLGGTARDGGGHYFSYVARAIPLTPHISLSSKRRKRRAVGVARLTLRTTDHLV
jgi:hypothetical protein